MTPHSKDGWSRPVAIVVTAFASLVALSTAHQSISYPTPISFDLACRIGLGRNCPGPCPTHLRRKDQSPNSPGVTVRRGGVLPVHVLKNNHVGGFSRWSLVKVSDMYNKKKHTANSFLYTCADVQVTYCTKKNQQRDCKVDRMNQFYKHFLRIPKVYPDGYYVLGWIWYGGLVSTGSHGAFGDYYDCVYIRVKGGPLENSYQPVFKPGKTLTGLHGSCRATTNRVGHCYREPCPFGNRAATLMKPAEFEGKKPSKILRKNFTLQSNKKTASNTVQKGESNSSDYKPPKRTPSPKRTTFPKPTSIPMPTPAPKKRNTDNSGASNAATGKKAKSNKQQQTPKSTAKSKGKTNNQNAGIKEKSSDTNNKTKQTGKKEKKQQSNSSRPSETRKPTNTPQTQGIDAKKVAKEQRSREKELRRKAKRRERRKKQLRKAEAKKAKLEAKRLRRKRVMEERAIKKEKRRREKQRKKEEKKARKQAKKQAKKNAKLSGKRSFARPTNARPANETGNMEYKDCFEKGVFPEDDGNIDYGDQTSAQGARN